MKKIKYIVLFFIVSISIQAQTDYSETWEDLFSYNHVIDFIQTSEKIVSLTDNALFIYDKKTKESEKLSSINGLSGDNTSAFYYDADLDVIVIGYENGLVEIIDGTKSITVKTDIKNFDVVGSKRINSIASDGDLLYLALPFGIVTLSLENNDFGDTFYIGSDSSEVIVNALEILDNKIYAGTDSGLFVASLDEPYLIDSNNWDQIFGQAVSKLTTYKNQIVLTNYNVVYKLFNDSFQLIQILDNNVVNLSAIDNFLCVSTLREVNLYDASFNLIHHVISQQEDPYFFKVTSAQSFDGSLYIGTTDFGILKSFLSTITEYEEIHPEGPISNEVFTVSALSGNLWVVYGGFGVDYVPRGDKKGISHYNGEDWITIPYAEGAIQAQDLVHVSIDPFHENRVYVSSYEGEVGLVVIEDDVVVKNWDYLNSPFESFEGATNISIRVADSVFDKEGNLWVTNLYVDNSLLKYSSSGEWTSYDTTSLGGSNMLNSIVLDNNETKWIGSQVGGAWVINKEVTKMKSLDAGVTTGHLPHRAVNALAIDDNNTVWIGTREGLVTFNSTPSFFEQATYEAKPIVIASGEDDGFGVALLGSQKINAICVDGAQNKWFGTDNGGVLYTNPSGRETFLHFDTSNSPLPSNRVFDIQFDENTGKIYFATARGLVSFDSNIVPYAEHLVDAYAYPNPATKRHEFVTIDGRNGNHLPDGTNVKILDAAGRLVHETNVVAGQEKYGGKVTWNKTNLAGRKVASGIYVVLLTIPDATETTMTKIAIVN